MGRSVKKGPFVQEALTKRVESMNARNEKRVEESHGQAWRDEARGYARWRASRPASRDSNSASSGSRHSAHDAPVALQDATRDRRDSRPGRERGAQLSRLLEEARGEADR